MRYQIDMLSAECVAGPAFDLHLDAQWSTRNSAAQYRTSAAMPNFGGSGGLLGESVGRSLAFRKSDLDFSHFLPTCMIWREDEFDPGKHFYHIQGLCVFSRHASFRLTLLSQ